MKYRPSESILIAIVKILYLLVMFCVLCALIKYLIKPKDNDDNYYPMIAKIVEINTEADVITCQNYYGFTYEFSGIEDWSIGDTVAAIMDNKDTANIQDDEIIDVKYSKWQISY